MLSLSSCSRYDKAKDPYGKRDDVQRQRTSRYEFTPIPNLNVDLKKLKAALAFKNKLVPVNSQHRILQTHAVNCLVVVQALAPSISFASLASALLPEATTSAGNGGAAHNGFRLSHVDEEGDEVTIDDEAGLREAVRMHDPAASSLRLTVCQGP